MRAAVLRAPSAALCGQLFRIIDLLSILPSYVALLMPEMHVLLDIRLLRMFRILKLTSYVHEYGVLGRARLPKP